MADEKTPFQPGAQEPMGQQTMADPGAMPGVDAAVNTAPGGAVPGNEPTQVIAGPAIEASREAASSAPSFEAPTMQMPEYRQPEAPAMGFQQPPAGIGYQQPPMGFQQGAPVPPVPPAPPAPQMANPYQGAVQFQSVPPEVGFTELSGGLKFGWLCIGMIMGIPGMLLAWLINFDKHPQVKKDAIMWSVIGFAIAIVCGIIFTVAFIGMFAAAISSAGGGYGGYYF